ncbi:hypothetical protein FRB90_006393 [Tulasnella sp. 427]|nr:hypothetical protein FRB90_006393 [Tulasnella sp. 427]
MSSRIRTEPAEPVAARKTAAGQTLKAIKDGNYRTYDGKTFQLAAKNRQLQADTVYFAPQDALLSNWRIPNLDDKKEDLDARNVPTDIHFRLQTTLAAAREWAEHPSASDDTQIGVLQCGDAVRPGGGFENGRHECQETSLARGTNVTHSLTSGNARPFYDLHKANNYNGYWTDAIIYSGGVTLLRDDSGDWMEPVEVDFITSSPVNAGLVRHAANNQPEVEQRITDVMEERMGKILRVFEVQGDKVLILTGFGTGMFRNSMRSVAKIWARLLGPGGRFQGKFTNVVFAIPRQDPFNEFCAAFREELQLRAALLGAL